jgi:transposase
MVRAKPANVSRVSPNWKNGPPKTLCNRWKRSVGSLPAAEWLIADRSYDADWFREALKEKGISPCIPGRKLRGKAVRDDGRRYKRRNRIEIMFDRLKDWRRIHLQHLQPTPNLPLLGSDRITGQRSRAGRWITCSENLCFQEIVQTKLPFLVAVV